MTEKEIYELAVKAREASYSPYSGFAVGAALVCRDGRIFTGANIENAAFSPSICAERVALFKAINDGERDFEAIGISGGKHGEKPVFCPPCGVCRQVMREFCGDDFRIILEKDGEVRSFTLAELLPESFSKGDF